MTIDIPSESWSDKFRARAASLSSNVDQVDTLCRGFALIASRWADQPASGGTPFASGVTANGDAVEMSVRYNQVSPAVDLRFIAQPDQIFRQTGTDKASYFINAIEFSYKFAGVSAASIVAAVCELLSESGKGIGNFVIWMGLEIQHKAKPLVKLYVNPFAISSEGGGLIAAEVMIRLAGLGTTVPTIQALDAAGWATLPHIIGLNIDSSGVVSFKIYFAYDRIQLAELGQIADINGPDRIFSEKIAKLTRHTAQHYGQAHVAFAWAREMRTPRFRVSLFCEEWFASDACVMTAASSIDSAVPAHRCDLAERNRRWFTFLGIDNTAAVLYTRV